MLTALSTGHDGSLCTVHAGSPDRGAAAGRGARADVRRRPAARRDPRADRRRLRPRRLPGALCRRLAARRLGRRGRPRRRGPGGARAVHVARRRAAAGELARSATTSRRGWRPRSAASRQLSRTARASTTRPRDGRRARVRRRRPRRSSGVWELLAAVERTRVGGARSRASSRRSCGPGARASRRRSPSGGGSRCSPRPRWPRPAGCSAGRRSRCSPASPDRSRATALVRARRRRFRAALAASAPVVARALADALSAGHAVRGALDVVAAGVPGRRRPRARRGRAGRCGSARATEAVLERLRRRAASPAWDAMVAGILLQRDAGGDLPGAAARPRARRSRPPRARTATRSPRPPRRASPRGSCSCCRSAPRCSPSSPSPACSPACSPTRSRPG